MPSNCNIKIFSLEARRRVNDQDYDFIKPNLSVGQVLLFDENIPVQVTGVTDIGGLNIRIRNLVEGWTCWVPFFSINFLQNRQCYQQISDERNLFKGIFVSYNMNYIFSLILYLFRIQNHEISKLFGTSTEIIYADQNSSKSFGRLESSEPST